MKSTLFLLLLFSFFNQASATSDDDFLFLIPSIIANAKVNSDGDPLRFIKQLNGSWEFARPDSQFNFVGEFRFNGNTAYQDKTYSDITIIEGAEYIADFSYKLDTPLVGSYSTQEKLYLVVEVWGPPTSDLVSYFFFSSAAQNSSTDCHYYGDTDGNIKSYYLGYGGTIPCNRLTKRKVSNLSALSVNNKIDSFASAGKDYSAHLARSEQLRALDIANKKKDGFVTSDLKYLPDNLQAEKRLAQKTAKHFNLK